LADQQRQGASEWDVVGTAWTDERW
jgi:hypothetical protein